MTPDALVIGAGPAGLMAADRLLAAGFSVLLAEAKPSPGRKLLMAGKSGLNLSKAETAERFLSVYAEAEDWLRPMLAVFGPDQVQDWARGLGQEVFTGSSGRVFPKAMKASPLLRAWLGDLSARGLDLRTRWRWVGGTSFATPEGVQQVLPKVTVLAMGGASWARLGSDGAWSSALAGKGIALAPFQPANMGFLVNWSPHMAKQFGQPLKSIALIAGTQRVRGEAVISARGIEGGGIYAVSRALREGAALFLDLFPDRDGAALAEKIAARPKGETLVTTLKKLGLSGASLALALECARPFPAEAPARAALLKALPVPLTGPRPMDEAISTAGGIARAALTDDLMLRQWPGVFAAGEMLDWEAPTGGYLLTACLATGRWAGDAAARFMQSRSG
ncbi:TIGR03862 family flavoprotein [Pararhodobacter zhoushanensis]|uniref:TIGR03862 family flavoprotein n=1 Tax=Pararhodobacter zhoushanensis TaxID=2479545 RepID=A0ABT3GUP6_9RHOB|nr:TIGR03862 family flavoprotein [Pararhodobacter zhoushanensis]MCW1931250.1 TIGR03862 family flavoprotein [Pararhodobacter zhoushanensis]